MALLGALQGLNPIRMMATSNSSLHFFADSSTLQILCSFLLICTLQASVQISLLQTPWMQQLFELGPRRVRSEY